jgi:hypothetical protein
LVLLLQADSEMDGNRRIWGTAYTQAEMTAAIRRFLVTFHAEAEEGAQQQQEQPAAAGMATYVGLLRQVRTDRVYTRLGSAGCALNT